MTVQDKEPDRASGWFDRGKVRGRLARLVFGLPGWAYVVGIVVGLAAALAIVLIR